MGSPYDSTALSGPMDRVRSGVRRENRELRDRRGASFLVNKVHALILPGGCCPVHFFGHCRSVTILKRPHTLRVEDAYTVAVVKEMAHVRLEAGHGAQLTVDKSDPPLLRRNSQRRQKIRHRAPFRKAQLKVGETSLLRFTAVPLQGAVKPHIHRKIRHFKHRAPPRDCVAMSF